MVGSTIIGPSSAVSAFSAVKVVPARKQKKGDTGGILSIPSSPCLPVAMCLYFNRLALACVCTRNVRII